ncbi:PH domain-containing protein [Luteimonas sp. RIT-PG2_3]
MGPERRLHPWSWLFVLLAQLRQFLLPLIVLVFFGGRSEDRYQLIGAGIIVLLLVGGSVRSYFTYRYRIGRDSLFVRSGLLERSLRQVPFSRIHNVALHQSLLHRTFGVAEVKLESAGGQKPEAQMRVLKLADALTLEQAIRTRGRANPADIPADAISEALSPPTASTASMPSKSSGTGTTLDDAHAGSTGRTLLRLSWADIVRVGLVSNRGMVVIAGAFALSWQVFPERTISHALRDLAEAGLGYAGRFNGDWLVTGALAASLVLVALLLVRLFSIALALIRYHGFRLDEYGRRLTVTRGLLTQLRTSVPRRRIQAWTLREGLLHRLLKRCSVEIYTASAQDPSNQERGLPELAPIATPADADALLQHLLDRATWPIPASQWQSLHPRAWLRLLIGDVVLAVLLSAALCWWFGPPGLLGLVWIAWGLLLSRRHAARAGYSLDDHLVAVREGWWSRHWRFAELDKLQALQLRQSPLDRWSGMASLWLDTAGAGAMAPSLRIRYLPLAQAQVLLERLQKEIARRPLRW